MLNCPTQSKTATEIRILRGKMPFYYRIREKYYKFKVLLQFFIEMNSLAFLESFAILHGPMKLIFDKSEQIQAFYSFKTTYNLA